MSKTQIDTHIHMGCRTVNQESNHNWQAIDMKNFKFPQGKIFLMFGGNTTNRPEAANGNAKVVERLLTEENREKSNIYSFMYDTEPLSSSTKHLRQEYELEVHLMYEKMIKPLLLDRVGNIKEKQGIEKVLKNLVFVSHCGGADFVNIIIDDIYQTLTEKYHPSIAEQLIDKLQYFAYAPNALPNHKVTTCVITPFLDVSYSWAKSLSNVSDKRINSDYPRGIVRKIFKAQEQGNTTTVFEQTFKKDRIISFKSEQSIYLIPSRINSNISVGDHSIDCLVKTNVLSAETDFAKTANLLNYSSKLVLNQFASDNPLDFRVVYEKITDKTFKNRVSEIKLPAISDSVCYSPAISSIIN